MKSSPTPSSITRLFLSMGILLFLSACIESDGSSEGSAITDFINSGGTSNEASETEAGIPGTEAAVQAVGNAPTPLSPNAIPESGEYTPDPVLVLYHFIFLDGTQVKFRENHTGDYWGDYPSAGAGQITRPDGSVETFDANRRVRHAGFGKQKTPVTTRSHGRKLFWMADHEGRQNVKKVTIFEDGWHPIVEGSMLATQQSLGINSPLIETVVRVEQRK